MTTCLRYLGLHHRTAKQIWSIKAHNRPSQQWIAVRGWTACRLYLAILMVTSAVPERADDMCGWSQSAEFLRG